MAKVRDSIPRRSPIPRIPNPKVSKIMYGIYIKEYIYYSGKKQDSNQYELESTWLTQI